tara:strand:- start:8733 stop:10469 length:1737 start_codon:yes stop_codon:yes gene_type:complete
MSIILGLNANHADSSACILINGKLEFAIEEERINRIKHWAGLPCESIKACLKNTGLSLNDITDISINTNPLSNINNKAIYFFKNYLLGEKKFEIAKRFKKKISLRNDLNKYFSPKRIPESTKIHYIDHHISHIASAYYPSGFKKAIGLSIDGFGDFCSMSIAKCENDKINVFKKSYFPDSLGVFYETFTQLIGFKNYGDEYKMMGLSSYGKPKYFDQILNNVFYRNSLKLNLNYFNHAKNDYIYKFEGKPTQNKLFSSKLEKLLDTKNFDINNISETQKNIASSVQKIFEKKILEIIQEIKKLNFSENLVFAGGCALNSLANKTIYDTKLFNNIFIPYAPGDGGGSIGAALYAGKKINKKEKFSNLKSPFLGTSFTNLEIEKTINSRDEIKKFDINFFENKEKLYGQVSKYIFENKIIGHFNGKMEFGARALGNRSILANPCNPKIKDIINTKIKRRENFRPFAPAILYENKKEWFSNDRMNPYMSAVELITENKRDIIPGITHIDGTGRVQTVTKEMNKDFYTLINKFYEISKVPILLNTSFNENEPIVLTPNDAFNCFLRTNMDVLVLNNFIISRY